MYFIKLMLTCFENHLLLTLSIVVSLLSYVYCLKFLRIFYYVCKLPGPFAYPILGNFGILLGTHEEITSKIIGEILKFGSLFRLWLGPVPIVMVMEPAYVQEVLNNGLEKAWIMRKAGYDLAGDSIMVAKVPKWKRNRGIVVKGFSPIILKSYFKVFLEKNTILLERLDQRLNDEKYFDIFEYLSRTAMDAVCGSTMGIDINAQETNSPYYNAAQNSFFLMFERIFRPWKLPDLIYNLIKDGKQSKENQNIIWGLASKVIAKKRSKISEANNVQSSEIINRDKNVFNKPLLDYLLDITQNHPEFSDTQLRDEINIVILGGYETSANSLSYVLINLATHKDIQNKVCEELFTVLGMDPERPINLDDLPNLKYMEMVIKESMRLYSTIPIIAREIKKDIQMGKYLMAKGTTCAIPIFCLHRDANVWEKPMEFNPERFTPENCINRHPYAYIPFGGGPRNCIGIRYAWMFMKTMLATLLRRYEFHTNLNLDEIKLQIEVSMKLIGGHQIRITPRKRNTL